jgi:hypothetical protein
VQAAVARITKCDQVLFRVIPKRASRSKVVNLKILKRSAPLAAPTVALQNPLAEYCVHCPAPFPRMSQP